MLAPLPVPLRWSCLEGLSGSPSKPLRRAAEAPRGDCWAWRSLWRARGRSRLPRLHSRPSTPPLSRRPRRETWHEQRYSSAGLLRQLCGPPPQLRAADATPHLAEMRLPCGLMPSQVSELLDRDITPDDYEMLLQLDEGVERPTASHEGVQSLPVAQEETFVGENCAVCLHAFDPADTVNILACKHFFHRDCIGKWLTEHRRSCPLCGEEAVPTEGAP